MRLCFICAVLYLVTPSCPTLCSPMDCSPPGSSVSGILQARILKWVAIPFSRGSSQPRDWTGVSCLQADSLSSEPQGKPAIWIVQMRINLKCLHVIIVVRVHHWTTQKTSRQINRPLRSGDRERNRLCELVIGGKKWQIDQNLKQEKVPVVSKRCGRFQADCAEVLWLIKQLSDRRNEERPVALEHIKKWKHSMKWRWREILEASFLPFTFVLG